MSFFWPEQPESEPGWSPKHGTKLGPGLKLNNFRSATLALIEVLILISIVYLVFHYNIFYIDKVFKFSFNEKKFEFF